MYRKIFFCFLLLLCAKLALAQTDYQSLRRIEEETREELKKTEELPTKEEKDFVWDFGGWVSHYFWRYEDSDDRKDYTPVRETNYTDLRLWVKATLYKKHIFYSRLKNIYIAKRDTSSRYTGIDDDYDGPHLDLGYFNFELIKPWHLIVGRQYFYLGKGIVYNRIHDGVQVSADYPSFSLKIFSSRTKPSEDRIDFSTPSFDKRGWQHFSGIEAAYLKNKNFIPYLYFLYEKDHPKEEPEDVFQDYNYDAYFYAGGLCAKANKNLSWWLELIKENGENYADSFVVSPEKKDIDAWAAIVGTEYNFSLLTHPSLEFEYAWGSGDNSRISTTNTAGGGNLYGNDTSFQYFGYYFAGYRLDPRLSNMHIYRMHLSLRPLEKFKFGKNILTGVKFFVYRKDKKNAGIYEDAPAVGESKDIGKEVNFYLYWIIHPKVAWSLRYGIFFPGGAYPENTDASTQYLGTYLTLSF